MLSVRGHSILKKKITSNQLCTLTHKLCPPLSTLTSIIIKGQYVCIYKAKESVICLSPPDHSCSCAPKKKKTLKVFLFLCFKCSPHTPSHSLNAFALAELSMWHKVIQQLTQSQGESYSLNARKLLLGNALCKVLFLLKG